MDINQNTPFWNYLPQGQKELLSEGQYLINDVIKDETTYKFHDYSFLIFPFAKAYEGFLKQLFKDVGFISHLDFISDHLRLGKLMSPNLIGRLGDRSIYKKIRQTASEDLAAKIWEVWKLGRNQVFHYFPHNLKAVTFPEANEIIERIMKIMEEAYDRLYVRNKPAE